MKVCIPAIADHLAIVRVSVAWLRKTMPDVGLTIVCPDPAQFAEFVPQGIAVAADADFAVIGKAALRAELAPDKQRVTGWYYQQLLKFAIVAAQPDDHVLILDADTVLLRDLRTSPPTFYTTREENAPYFEHYGRLMGASRTLTRSAVANFMVFAPASLRDMLADIERRHGAPWWKAIVDIANAIDSPTAFSEYETYANWMAAANPAQPVQPLRLFRRGDLLVSSPPDFDRVSAAAARRSYDAIAFEMQHRSDFRRRLQARLVMALGLAPW